MFEGELEGLHEIEKSKTIRVPHPFKVMQFIFFFQTHSNNCKIYNIYPLLQVVDLKSTGTAIAMEYIDMSTLSKYAEKLGEQLAR